MKYKIWSIEHKSWWNSNQVGYTQSYEKAGVYDEEIAMNICFNGNYIIKNGIPNEAMVPIKEKKMMNEILDSSKIDTPIEENDYEEAYKRYISKYPGEQRISMMLDKMDITDFEILAEHMENVYSKDICNKILEELYFTKPGE